MGRLRCRCRPRFARRTPAPAPSSGSTRTTRCPAPARPSARDGDPARRRLLAEAGFAVASVDYRTTMSGSTYVDGVRDVRSAIRFLRAHNDVYGLDTRRIAVWGESAGGY